MSRHSPDAAIREFSPEELRQFARDLGFDPLLQQRILEDEGEFAETELLASFVCSVLDELDRQGVEVADYVRAVDLRRSIAGGAAGLNLRVA